MSLVTLPSWFMPDSFLPRLSTVERVHSSPFGGVEQAVDMLNDRWMVSLSLPASSHADAARIEALIASMRGASNTIALYHFIRPAPNGTLRGSPVIITAAAQGADEIEIAGVAGETLLAGDLIGVGGLLLMVASDCTADEDGVMTVPIVNRLRTAQAGLTRASTATYYDGVTTAKADENLLLRSQEFDNAAWTKSNVSITANSTAAPDGTITADTVTGIAGTTLKYIAPAASESALNAAVATYSIYAKEGTHRYIQVSINGDATKYVNFDLNGSGAYVANGSGVTGSITVSTNGFIRCTVTLTGAAGTNKFFTSLQDSTAATREASTASTGTIFLWGAQCEVRSVVTAYTPTTTATVSNTISALVSAAVDVARFDHDPVSLAPLGLLAEAAATNLMIDSEAIGSWSQVNTVTSSNFIVAPDGTITAEIVVANTSGAQHRVEQSVSITSGTTYTFSIYARYAGLQYIAMRAANDTITVYFDLVNGTKSAGLATMESVGRGWYRCSVTGTANTTSSSAFRVNVSDTATLNNFVGDSWDGAFLWGAQVEVGSAPTAYIKTVASQVTRSADVVGTVTWDRPTAPFRMVSKSAPQYVPGFAESVSLDFVEAIA